MSCTRSRPLGKWPSGMPREVRGGRVACQRRIALVLQCDSADANGDARPDNHHPPDRPGDITRNPLGSPRHSGQRPRFCLPFKSAY